MKFKFNWKYYLRGTLILLLIFAIVLVCFYPVAFKGSQIIRRIFFIAYFSTCGGLIALYWIYGVIREYKIYKRDAKLNRVIKKEDSNE